MAYSSISFENSSVISNPGVKSSLNTVSILAPILFLTTTPSTRAAARNIVTIRSSFRTDKFPETFLVSSNGSWMTIVVSSLSLPWELLGLCIYHPSVSLESATSSSQARDKDRSSPFLPRHWGKGFACTGRSKECTKVEICVLSCSWILQEETPRLTTKERKYPPEAGNNYYWEKMKQI